MVTDLVTNGAGMTGKIKNMVNRNGRYHARLVVPKDLRGIVGKTELRTPLGGDYRQALKLLPGAVAQLQHQIALAERQAGRGQPLATQARYPLAPDQIAHSHYTQRLAFDDVLRNDPRYPSVGIDDVLVNRLRMAIAGSADNDELSALVVGADSQGPILKANVPNLQTSYLGNPGTSLPERQIDGPQISSSIHGHQTLPRLPERSEGGGLQHRFRHP
jgi:Domain of unknown function (DUF6538)